MSTYTFSSFKFFRLQGYQFTALQFIKNYVTNIGFKRRKLVIEKCHLVNEMEDTSLKDIDKGKFLSVLSNFHATCLS